MAQNLLSINSGLIREQYMAIIAVETHRITIKLSFKISQKWDKELIVNNAKIMGGEGGLPSSLLRRSIRTAGLDRSSNR